MKILGIDFTSAPSRRKPITCLTCSLAGDVLRVGKLERWDDFDCFERCLNTEGPWIAGIDFPFGQAREFIETIGWPRNWRDYVLHAHALGRGGFRETLDRYRLSRGDGDKEHRRVADEFAGAISPQKLYGVPVALMFFEGAPRLIQAGVFMPHLRRGDPHRIAVEAYPGWLARRLIGRRSYKNDSRAKQTADQRTARLVVLRRIKDGSLFADYGLTIEIAASTCFIDDASGDSLDALLAAIQTAWAWTKRDRGFGAPDVVDTLEGWIADPRITRGINAARHVGDSRRATPFADALP